MFYYGSESPQVKRYLIFSITNLVFVLTLQVAERKLRILENLEILEKSQIWMETNPSAQSTSHFTIFLET